MELMIERLGAWSLADSRRDPGHVLFGTAYCVCAHFSHRKKKKVQGEK